LTDVYVVQCLMSMTRSVLNVHSWSSVMHSGMLYFLHFANNIFVTYV